MSPRRAVVALAIVSISLMFRPPPAAAGGFGFFDATGFHFGRALREGGGSGRWLDQGGGVELFLGDRDRRLHGRLRFAYQAVVDLDGGTRHAGVLSGGVRVELLPDVESKFGFYVAADMGITPIVTHLRAWFFLDAGPGIRVNPVEKFSLFFEAMGLFRYEKGVQGGPIFHLGARFALD
jgi:hypothetical protein